MDKFSKLKALLASRPANEAYGELSGAKAPAPAFTLSDERAESPEYKSARKLQELGASKEAYDSFLEERLPKRNLPTVAGISPDDIMGAADITGGLSKAAKSLPKVATEVGPMLDKALYPFAVGAKSQRSLLDKINKEIENKTISKSDFINALNRTEEKLTQRQLQALLGARVLEKGGMSEKQLVEAARQAFEHPRAKSVPVLATNIREINKHLKSTGRRRLDSNALGAYYPTADDIVARLEKEITPVQTTSTVAHELQHAIERDLPVKSKPKSKRDYKKTNPSDTPLDIFQNWSQDHHVSTPYDKKSFEVGKLLEMLKSEIGDVPLTRPIDDAPRIVQPAPTPIVTEAPVPTTLKFPTPAAAPIDVSARLAELYAQMEKTTNLIERLKIAKEINMLEGGSMAADSVFPGKFGKLFSED
jgi:hypothetical protein